MRVTITPPINLHTLALASLLALAGCGGSKDEGTSTRVPSGAPGSSAAASAAGARTAALSGVDLAGSNANLGPTPTTLRDAVRLADQATFGPSDALTRKIQAVGPKRWLVEQFGLYNSAFTSGGDNSLQTWIGGGGFCDNKPNTCWRDQASNHPLAWDFYRNAVNNQDQLRQRVAFALSQITVVSSQAAPTTIGLRNFNNMLLKNALSNYRDVLKGVALSPVMGEYLNGVDNNKTAPNENFSRELLQLFSVGTCLLNMDGSLMGGACQPTYDNGRVREYAYALTGWTYPKGGKSPWGCPTNGSNCKFFDGDMVPAPALHDSEQRALLGNVKVPAGTTAPAALEKVLDSLMAHPNIGPFIGRQLIQMLVTSNPTRAYVTRVASAFNSGSYDGFGTGVRGDMQATLAAVLLDFEARNDNPDANFGKLREPVQVFTGVLRALNGKTDGEALASWWGDLLGQAVYNAPSVFNFYPPDYPVAGTALQGPAFAIHNTSHAINRLNFINYLTNWSGSAPGTTVPNPLGTRVDLTPFEAVADDADVLVDRVSQLALGQNLPSATRTRVIEAVNAFSQTTAGADWKKYRVKSATYLVFASPQYNVIR